VQLVSDDLEPVPDDPRVDDDAEAPSEPTPFRYDITASGADPLVDGLVRRIKSEDLIVPRFQRGFVWSRRQADRFIESLLLGLPVPGFFFAEDPEDPGRQLVLDGQQRLITLTSFYRGVFQGREYALRFVQDQFKDCTYETLEQKDRRRLDNTAIHATIVRQNQPSDDQSSIYFIFERINSGGTSLVPQEIRSALYHGRFESLLEQLNDNRAWRTVFGKNKSARMKDRELILRFFALYFWSDQYKRPIKDFLNKFMGWNRELTQFDGATLTPLFQTTISVIAEALGAAAFRPQTNINAAVFDSVMVGVARRLEARGPIVETAAFTDAYYKLLGNPDYVTTISRATADEERVRGRLSLATAVFSEVP
jgi:uncharacterized protein with ParB-like and HNH nuclease domain